MSTITKKEAIAELYRRGTLRWKCHAGQTEMYDIFYNAPPHSTLVWLISRQFGKSYQLAILALEQAYREPHSVIKLLTDTKLHIQSIFDKIFEEILVDCPEHLKPHYHKNKYVYEFYNGSQIQLAGSDSGHFERLRGAKCKLVLVDEAGFCSNLETIVKSVLLPTTTHTGGKIVLASTPPEEYEHDFFKFIEEAQFNNTLTTKTIDENPLLTKDQIKDIEKRMGGRESERFRREYLCHLIKSADTSVIPEFTEELEKEIVKDWPKPPHYDCYESMDLGGKDLTGVLFAYFDFRAGKVIIEDELVLDFSKRGIGLPQLIDGIKNKEYSCWNNIYTNEVKKPSFRVSDINYIVTQEIATMSHGELSFITPKKDDKDSAINNLRTLLAAKKIIIHPRCVNLIRHLKNVRWFSIKNKEKFARSPDNGHYDLVDCLIYLIRTMSFVKNPYPYGYDAKLRPADTFVYNPENYCSGSQNQLNVFKKMFNIKNKR